MQLNLRVHGMVVYRKPGGALSPVPPGDCVADVRGGNVQMMWNTWRGRASAVLPLAEFEKHRQRGRIVLR